MEYYRLAPVPAQFFQEEEQVPFTRCASCDAEFDADTVYIVEKAFQTYLPYRSRDVVFEYAICLDCYEGLSQSFSAQSRQAMDEYVSARVDLEERARTLYLQAEHSDELPDIDAWLSTCFISGKSPADLDGFQIAGVFIGSSIILSHTPLLVSADVVGEITERLSKETIDILGGFAEDVLPKPPGFERDLVPPVLVI